MTPLGGQLGHSLCSSSLGPLHIIECGNRQSNEWSRTIYSNIIDLHSSSFGES